MKAALLGLCGLLLAACGSGSNAPPPKSAIRYEPPPELPPYEQDEKGDPLAVLEALEAPETKEGNAAPPLGSGGGPAAPEEAPGSSGGTTPEPAAIGGGPAVGGSASAGPVVGG